MATHDGLDRFGSLISVVEWDGGDVVMENMGLDDTVHKSAANEAKFAVDGCRGAPGVAPSFSRVVGEGWVRVLKKGNCH